MKYDSGSAAGLNLAATFLEKMRNEELGMRNDGGGAQIEEAPPYEFGMKSHSLSI